MSESAAQGILERQALDYRNKAEELRTVGENTRSPEARRILLGLADDADRAAAAIETQLKALPKPIDRSID